MSNSGNEDALASKNFKKLNIFRIKDPDSELARLPQYDDVDLFIQTQNGLIASYLPARYKDYEMERATMYETYSVNADCEHDWHTVSVQLRKGDEAFTVFHICNKCQLQRKL